MALDWGVERACFFSLPVRLPLRLAGRKKKPNRKSSTQRKGRTMLDFYSRLLAVEWRTLNVHGPMTSHHSNQHRTFFKVKLLQEIIDPSFSGEDLRRNSFLTVKTDQEWTTLRSINQSDKTHNTTWKSPIDWAIEKSRCWCFFLVLWMTESPSYNL